MFLKRTMMQICYEHFTDCTELPVLMEHNGFGFSSLFMQLWVYFLSVFTFILISPFLLCPFIAVITWLGMT